MRIMASLDVKFTNSKGLSLLQRHPSVPLITTPSGHYPGSLNNWVFVHKPESDFLTRYRLFSQLLSCVNFECTPILLFSEKDNPGIWFILPIC